jgi:hypothetical protein
MAKIGVGIPGPGRISKLGNVFKGIGAGPPTGASSCGSMTIATSFRRRQTSCPRSTSTASESCQTRGIDEAAGAWDSERLRAVAARRNSRRGRHAGRERHAWSETGEHAAPQPLLIEMVADAPLAGPSSIPPGLAQLVTPLGSLTASRGTLAGGNDGPPARPDPQILGETGYPGVGSTHPQGCTFRPPRAALFNRRSQVRNAMRLPTNQGFPRRLIWSRLFTGSSAA